MGEDVFMAQSIAAYPLLTPAELAPASELLAGVLRELNTILLGREDLHRMVLAGILSRGHILLEGLPGLGKTALVKALGQLLQLPFKRVQFTPDLRPSDILGAHILQDAPGGGGRQMIFQPGPVFTSILLADEINRASPKTQSALLEAMQEHCVTLLGTTRALPQPFFVLASQNPIELEGTYPLPEAQLDRFLFKLSVAGAEADVLERIITTRRHGEAPAPTRTVTGAELGGLFKVVDRVFLPRPVSRYIARLVSATHPSAPEAPAEVKAYVQYGASPRAAIAMAEAARAAALIAGRPTAGFEDVALVAPAVLNHRLLLNYKAKFDRVDSFVLIGKLLSTFDAAGSDLPAGIRVAAIE
jgi:MoxR-like ATPase